ncbi:MAG TPA: TonB-dependent receptor [Chitinophagaceae bacterium]|nr:TonB-dependent receptor [Chitinophagaceae bacterium]
MRHYLLILSITVLASTARAQTAKTITGNFADVPFNQFIQEVEAQTGYHFYYDASQTDSLKITYRGDRVPLTTALDEILQQYGLRYSIDDQGHIFITKAVQIYTTLPPGFFGTKKAVDTTSFAVEEPEETEEEKAKNKLKASLENKLFEVGVKTNTIGQGNATIAGYVRDEKTGEPIIGANITAENKKTGTVTDQFGYFSLTLPKGRQVLLITSIGMNDTKRQVMLYSDGKLNIDMFEYVPTLKRVIVSADKTVNVKGVDMGVQKINIKNIKQIPTAFGEADVLRAVLTMPGVTSVGESSTGFNVRGGAADENLILFSDATIYNPSHFFGFFSAFNPDVVKDVELYKSSIPERYGGRLASVLDVTSREGNKKKFAGNGGIGPLTSRLTLEGPIDSGRTSFILGGRTTYSDWLLKQIPNDDYKNSSARFYDVNLNISHEFNAKNNLYITGYLSQDKFRLNSDTTYKYSNKNANIKYKHIFNNKLYGVFTAGVDAYNFSISSVHNPVNAYKFAFDINQTNFRADFNYSPNNKHTIDFGLTSILYKLHPGTYDPDDKQSLVVADHVQAEQGLESALYIGDHYDVSSKFSVSAGLRYSMFNYLGPQTQYEYAPGLPRETVNIIDTVNYPKGKVIKTYQGPEIRLSARYSLGENASVKVSYNSLRQYIHMLSNTTAISPTDIWKLSDAYIKPQLGDQVSLGLYHNFKSNTIETSVEVYYKRLENYLDYKSGAQLVLNHHIETDIANSKGYAYGAELLIKKTAGKLNGWVSYTYSRTMLKTDDPLVTEPVNKGAWYPSDYDKPNIVNFIGNYRFSHRFSISLNVIYSTGRPITLPIAEYYYGGSYRVLYSDRNQYRIPDYFRTDFSMNIEGNHKIKQFAHNSWTIGLYNLTGRKNPYSVYFTSENGVVNGYKLSIFGTVIPFINYNFRF